MAQPKAKISMRDTDEDRPDRPEQAADDAAELDIDKMSVSETFDYAAVTLGGGDPKHPTTPAYIRGLVVMLIIAVVAFYAADREMEHEDQVTYRAYTRAEFVPPDSDVKLVMPLPVDTSLAYNRAKQWQGGALLDQNDDVMLTFWVSQGPPRPWEGDVVEKVETRPLPRGTVTETWMQPKVTRFGSYARWEHDVSVVIVSFDVKRPAAKRFSLRVLMREQDLPTMLSIARELADKSRLLPK